MRLIILYILIVFASLTGDVFGINDRQIKMKLQYYKNKLSDDTLQIERKVAIIDSIMTLTKEENKVTEEISWLKKKGDLCLDGGFYGTAMSVYNKVLDRINENIEVNELNKIKLETLINMGRLCYFTGKYDAGISYIYDVLKYNDTNEEIYNVTAHSLLGSLFSSAEKPDIAKRHLREALKLLAITNPKDSIVMSHRYTIYNCFAGIYSTNKDYDSSLICLKQAQKYCNNDVNKMNIIYQNTAVLYTHIEEWQIAEEYFLKAFKLETRPYEKLVIMNNLAMVRYKQKRYDEALALCTQAIKIADDTGAMHIKSSLVYLIADIYASKGNYKLAFEYKERGQQVFDSLFNMEAEQNILLLNNDFEMYKIENDKKILEYKIEVAELGNFKKTILIVAIVILLIIVLVVAIIISRRLIKQNRDNKMMRNTIDRFDETKQEIIQSSKEHFATEINQQARELTANAIFIAKMCDVATQMSENIKKLKKHYNSSDTDLIFKELQSSLNSLSIEEKGWEDFKIYFEQVHQSFFPNLNAAHPGLTPGENRMCAFIIMNLSTKEIAMLTNRSIRTIDTIKFRIRKKLNIPGDVTTSSYLRQFIV